MSENTKDNVKLVLIYCVVLIALLAFFTFIDRGDKSNAARVWSAECDSRPAVLVYDLRTGISSYSALRLEDSAEISGGIQGCVFVRQLDD